MYVVGTVQPNMNTITEVSYVTIHQHVIVGDLQVHMFRESHITVHQHIMVQDLHVQHCSHHPDF